ncbi:hypothetical protein CPB86DRAFT_819918 [Serendipita vermifera]|nr:hypothetical protein CPB86DRAFT_819918 [Serendipita vermifera]
MRSNTAIKSSTHRKSTRRARQKRKVGRRSTKAPLGRPGPINSVPNEILSLIFHHYVKMGGVVWRLIPVSKRWERIAFDTRSLWTSILIQNRTPRDKSVKEFIYNDDIEYYKKDTECSSLEYTSKHVCFEPDHLRKALSRTGECFLDIQIRFRSPSGRNNFSLDFMIDMLMEPAISTRIRSLELDIDETDAPTTRTDHFDHVSLPNLRQLNIFSAPEDWTRNLLRSISASTKKLDVMECFSDEPVAQYLSDRILNQIRVFTHDASEGFDNIVHKLVNVEEIAFFPFNWPSATTSPSTLLHLQTASLNCHPCHIRRIQWPSLETLWVGARGVPGTPSSPQIIEFEGKLTQSWFSMLKSLYINSGHPLHWLANVSAPRLAMLFVEWDRRPNLELPTGLIFSPFTSIKRFHFCTPCDDEEIISLLKLMPNVTTADISPALMKSDFGLGLLRGLAEAGNDSLLCPELDSLTLGGPSHRVRTQRAALEPEIKRLIQMEERSISSLRVYWGTRDRPQQYASTSRTC